MRALLVSLGRSLDPREWKDKPVLHTRRRGKKYTGNHPVGQTAFHALLMLSTIISSAEKGIVKGFLGNIGAKMRDLNAESSHIGACVGGAANLPDRFGVV
jgi:hypothetical protein